MRLFIFWIIIFLVSAFAQAQGKAKSSGEFSISTGPLLPNQIEGMSEIMSTWGMRYKPMDWSMEFGFANSNGSGVNYNAVTMSYRGTIPMEGFSTLLYAGLDSHYYRPAGSASYISSLGAHVGGGMMAFIGDRVWFRSEMKFNFNPGTALYIGFGFNFILSDGSKN